MRSRPVSICTSSPSPARATLRSMVVTEARPIDAPELTDRAWDSAHEPWSAWARISTVDDLSVMTSVPEIDAFSTDATSFSVTVPAAAAAIRPNAAAAANTSL